MIFDPPAAPVEPKDIEPPPSSPAIVPRDGRVRLLEAGDLDKVAALFLRKFRPFSRDRTERVVANVARSMREIYLQGASGDAVDSLVQIDPNGDIGGFLGFIRITYQLDGRPLTAGVASALMAADGSATGRAVPQLLRALNTSSLDMMLSDSANRTSIAFARPMRYELAPLESLEWGCAFRPAALLQQKMRHRWPLAPTMLLTPFAAAADKVAARVLRGPQAEPGRWRSDPADAAAFASAARALLPDTRLRPAWPAQELDWLLAQAARKRSVGPLRFFIVRDALDAVAGCYAMYGEKGRVARVLQVLAREGRWAAAIGSLLQTAGAMGCVGVHGQSQAAMMPHLFSNRGVVFYYGGGAMVRSRHPEVIRAVRAGQVMIGGLAGDRWTRLDTDDFTQDGPDGG